MTPSTIILLCALSALILMLRAQTPPLTEPLLTKLDPECQVDYFLALHSYSIAARNQDSVASRFHSKCGQVELRHMDEDSIREAMLLHFFPESALSEEAMHYKEDESGSSKVFSVINVTMTVGIVLVVVLGAYRVLQESKQWSEQGSEVALVCGEVGVCVLSLVGKHVGRSLGSFCGLAACFGMPICYYCSCSMHNKPPAHQKILLFCELAWTLMAIWYQSALIGYWAATGVILHAFLTPFLHELANHHSQQSTDPKKNSKKSSIQMRSMLTERVQALTNEASFFTRTFVLLSFKYAALPMAIYLLLTSLLRLIQATLLLSLFTPFHFGIMFTCSLLLTLALSIMGLHSFHHTSNSTLTTSNRTLLSFASLFALVFVASLFPNAQVLAKFAATAIILNAIHRYWVLSSQLEVFVRMIGLGVVLIAIGVSVKSLPSLFFDL